ncbi:MAG: AAA family ATPase [Candidatus Cloacimonadota bacterium]|nr:MAG: AAA family ATPase [Candidatus Cloacimonadota bacterium]PIE79220.1 MAG: AAA family ATPase [Candidatus Delongbacteria bacterium]
MKNIDNILKIGEDKHIEFKSEFPHNDSFAKELVAFSNTEGGVLYLGISDNKKVVGVEDSKDLEERIINICRNNITPPIVPNIEKIVYNDKLLYTIIVEKGINKPYKVKSSNKFYIRVGSISIEPTNSELIRLFQEGGNLHFEVNSCERSSFNDFDSLKFRDYCENIREIDFNPEVEEIKKLAYNLDLLDEREKLNIVGSLFFSKNPEKLLPQSGIELNYYSGKDQTSDILDSKVLTLSIPDAISGTLSFVRNNSREKVVFNDDETLRNKVYQYEPFVIRELVANAFSHRDWSIFGQRIRVNMFSDRLEIFSPGSLPNTLTLSRALFGISYYRNPLIAQILRDYKFVDRLGRGLMKVRTFYEKLGLKRPEFIVEDNIFLVRVWKRYQD